MAAMAATEVSSFTICLKIIRWLLKGLSMWLQGCSNPLLLGVYLSSWQPLCVLEIKL